MIRFLTSGESHGRCLTVIIEGLPSGLRIERSFIDQRLRARQCGYGRGERMKIEQDRVDVTSGIRGGMTLGSPITMTIENRDASVWEDVMDAFKKNEDAWREKEITSPRPGHADLPGLTKYGFSDIRNVLERASARETAARVAVGAVCELFLREFGMRFVSFVVQIGRIKARDFPRLQWREIEERTEHSDLRCLDQDREQEMKRVIDEVRLAGDSIGGIFEVRGYGVPIGLGSYVQWDRRLDARLASALMSIPGVKGVEIGLGFRGVRRSGYSFHDEIFYRKRKGLFRRTNNSGGLEGGVTTGEPICTRAFMKPIPTLRRNLRTVDLLTLKPSVTKYERSDTCVVPAASVIGRAVLAIEVCKVFQEKFGGDSMDEVKRTFRNYLKYVEERYSR